MGTAELLQTQIERPPEDIFTDPEALYAAPEAVVDDLPEPVRLGEASMPEEQEAQGRRSGRIWRGIAVGVGATALFMASYGSLKTDTAEASTGPPPVTSAADLPPTFTAKFKTERSSAKIKVSDLAKGKVSILANVSAKPLSIEKVRKLRSQGDCHTFNGNNTEVWTYGLPASGGGKYGRDRRTSEFCRVGGHWVRVLCKNPAIIRETPPPRKRIEGRVIFVKSFAKARVLLHAESKAEASCQEGGASAKGYGSAYANVKARLKTLARTKGASAVHIQAEINGKAWTQASAEAQCSNEESEVVIIKPPETPPPPPPPEQPKNKPPTGEMKPPIHLFPNGIGKICVDNLSDPEGDVVTASNFRVWKKGDAEMRGVGQFLSGVYSQPGGAQCIDYKAPPNAGDAFTVSTRAQISDGHTHTDTAGNPFTTFVGPKDFIIEKEDFGG